MTGARLARSPTARFGAVPKPLAARAAPIATAKYHASLRVAVIRADVDPAVSGD